jgi:hypothetical protein
MIPSIVSHSQLKEDAHQDRYSVVVFIKFKRKLQLPPNSFSPFKLGAMKKGVLVSAGD